MSIINLLKAKGPECHFHCIALSLSLQLFAVAATLMSIDYNVAMTFILNNNSFIFGRPLGLGLCHRKSVRL